MTYLAYKLHPKSCGQCLHTRGASNEKWDDYRSNGKVRIKDEARGGSPTHQCIFTPPFVIIPSEIPSYPIQQHITQVSELWDEYWSVSRGICLGVGGQ